MSEHRRRQAEHIAAAAMTIISRDGVAALSMSAIADEAGVSRQTLYKYYPDVGAVLVGITRMSESMESDLLGRVESADDAAAGLIIFMEAMLGAAASGHPSPTALMSVLPPEARANLQAHSDRAEGLVIHLLRRGLDDGSFRADLDPELDGRIVYGTLLAAGNLAEQADIDSALLAAHATAAIFRIVAPEP